MPEKIYLFDSEEIHENLLPLSFTRPVADFRVGIVTLKEKWSRYIEAQIRCLPVDYLREMFGDVEDDNEPALFVAGNIIPDKAFCSRLKNLKINEGITDKNEVVAFRGSYIDFINRNWKNVSEASDLRRINYLFDIFLENPKEIENDFKVLTKSRKSKSLPEYVRVVKGPEQKEEELIFIEEGAEVDALTINISRGPVYIGKNSIIMEGSMLRGPLAVCEGVKIRMGAKIYSGSTFGPYSKVGGEVDNTVIFGFSNKSHDGYLGNAVIGEWCNIGAGVNASNLKNDYSKIRVWNYRSKRFMKTDLQFCGLIMGDHSKIGINCMFNTATVVGVGVNMHGAGFPRVYLPGFREGSPSAGFTPVAMEKFLDIAARVMSRRGRTLENGMKNVFNKIYEYEHEK